MLIRDVSRAGHELSRAEVDDLRGTMALGAVLAHRVRTEVADYNQAPSELFTGLVQPVDAVRYAAGSRLRVPRTLDAERCVQAVEEAAAAGVLRVRVDGGELIADLGQELEVEAVSELLVVLERPVVADV